MSTRRELFFGTLGLTEAALLAACSDNTSRKDQALIARVVPRPPHNKDYAIVFEEGFMPFNGQRSPKSFLAIKFKFIDKMLPGPDRCTNPDTLPITQPSGSVV